MDQATTTRLTDRLDHLLAAPTDMGTLDLVVRRPANGTREVLSEGTLDLELGMVGDNWLARATSRAVAAGRHLDAQVNVMSSRMVGLLAADDETRAGAGDQLYVDLDLSHANLPAGTRLAIGDDGAVIEVSAKPHNGCKKFLARFGDGGDGLRQHRAGPPAPAARLQRAGRLGRRGPPRRPGAQAAVPET